MLLLQFSLWVIDKSLKNLIINSHSYFEFKFIYCNFNCIYKCKKKNGPQKGLQMHKNLTKQEMLASNHLTQIMWFSLHNFCSIFSLWIYMAWIKFYCHIRMPIGWKKLINSRIRWFFARERKGKIKNLNFLFSISRKSISVAQAKASNVCVYICVIKISRTLKSNKSFHVVFHWRYKKAPENKTIKSPFILSP